MTDIGTIVSQKHVYKTLEHKNSYPVDPTTSLQLLTF